MLVTKDVPLRVKAGAVGLEADEYHAQDVVLTGYTGMANVHVARESSMICLAMGKSLSMMY